MAGEILYSDTFALTNGELVIGLETFSKQIDQATAGRGGGTKTLTTSDQAVTLDNITTPGVVRITNLDDTNYVDIGPDSSGALVPFIRLLPGERWTFRLTPTAAVRAQAHSASVRVDLLALEA